MKFDGRIEAGNKNRSCGHDLGMDRGAITSTGELCGKPGVDFIGFADESRRWLCAEHWDEFVNFNRRPSAPAS